jgi:hypothetical protein
MMKSSSLAVTFMAAIVGMAMAAPPVATETKKENVASADDTPKQALRKLATAIEAGDAAAVRTFMAIDPSNAPADADKCAAILASRGRLRKVIREKLGADALREWDEETGGDKRLPLDAVVKEIEAANVSRTAGGTTEVGPLNTTFAFLTYPSTSIRLRQVDHVWKIDLLDWALLPRGDEGKPVPRRVATFYAEFQCAGDINNRVADQVEQGKVKTVEGLRDAVWRASGNEPPHVALAPSAAKKEHVPSPDDNPKDALRKLVTAVETGDAAAARMYMAIDPSNDPAYADNWASILASRGRLRKAIREKLGADALRNWDEENEGGVRSDLKVQGKEIEAAKVRLAGGGAVEVGPLETTGHVLECSSGTIRLRQVDHVWKIDMKDWTGIARGEKHKRFLPDCLGWLLQFYGDLNNSLAAGLEQGKIRTAEEFAHAQGRAMGKEPPPQSPSTPKPLKAPRDGG